MARRPELSDPAEEGSAAPAPDKNALPSVGNLGAADDPVMTEIHQNEIKKAELLQQAKDLNDSVNQGKTPANEALTQKQALQHQITKLDERNEELVNPKNHDTSTTTNVGMTAQAREEAIAANTEQMRQLQERVDKNPAMKDPNTPEGKSAIAEYNRLNTEYKTLRDAAPVQIVSNGRTNITPNSLSQNDPQGMNTGNTQTNKSTIEFRVGDLTKHFYVAGYNETQKTPAQIAADKANMGVTLALGAIAHGTGELVTAVTGNPKAGAVAELAANMGLAMATPSVAPENGAPSQDRTIGMQLGFRY